FARIDGDAGKSETPQTVVERRPRRAEVQQGADHHVAGDPADRLEDEGAHRGRASCRRSLASRTACDWRAISAATKPAPKPLSMFTTVTFAAQEFSIARRAAIPPREAPYPTLVGTAITGRATNPPTTEGSAPSIPAHTTSASASR